MDWTPQKIVNAEVQIFLTFDVPLWLYVVLLLATPRVLAYIVDRMISKKPKKKEIERKILNLTVFGTFIIALALGANSGIKFGNLPSTASLFNPLLGFIPIYMAYLLQRAIQDKRIR
tara:strand:- start:76 stop:426 length:351 start_codon:yes stop_codon:yes gene_type:complete